MRKIDLNFHGVQLKATVTGDGDNVMVVSIPRGKHPLDMSGGQYLLHKRGGRLFSGDIEVGAEPAE